MVNTVLRTERDLRGSLGGVVPRLLSIAGGVGIGLNRKQAETEPTHVACTT
jgi:hypothetical protein